MWDEVCRLRRVTMRPVTPTRRHALSCNPMCLGDLGPPTSPMSSAGTPGTWGSKRRSSSASPQEQDGRKDWGHAQLLEGELARSPPGC